MILIEYCERGLGPLQLSLPACLFLLLFFCRRNVSDAKDATAKAGVACSDSTKSKQVYF